MQGVPSSNLGAPTSISERLKNLRWSHEWSHFRGTTARGQRFDVVSRSKAPRKEGFGRNTAAEEARIRAGIKADPDTRPLTAKDFGNMVPVADMMKQRRGRPTTAAP